MPLALTRPDAEPGRQSLRDLADDLGLPPCGPTYAAVPGGLRLTAVRTLRGRPTMSVPLVLEWSRGIASLSLGAPPCTNLRLEERRESCIAFIDNSWCVQAHELKGHPAAVRDDAGHRVNAEEASL